MFINHRGEYNGWLTCYEFRWSLYVYPRLHNKGAKPFHTILVTYFQIIFSEARLDLELRLKTGWYKWHTSWSGESTLVKYIQLYRKSLGLWIFLVSFRAKPNRWILSSNLKCPFVFFYWPLARPCVLSSCGWESSSKYGWQHLS